MFKMDIGFKKYDFKAKEFIRDLDAALQAELKKAVVKALEAMIPRVPVYTGSSRGALQAIGRVVDEIVPIDPIAFRKGEGPGAGEAKSKASISTPVLYPKFKFSTEVKQFLFLETQGSTRTNSLGNVGPWGVKERARKVMFEYLRANLNKNIPNLGSYVLRQR